MAKSLDVATTTRNYRDNFDFKQLTTDVLIPKYFPDLDISTRQSGMVGMTTEQLAIISEDSFFSTSTLLKEFFITKATLPQSIYNYAAIFQISDIMGTAASCRFLLVLDEKKITAAFEEANMYATSETQNIITLGKNTTFFVEEIPFTLDYDIEITRKKTKLHATDYVYGARYVIGEFNNSISDIKNPYIKIRRTTDGYFALDVTAHQCTRTVTEEPIITNSAINRPVVEIPFDGILAGFDAFYREAGQTEWTQMLLRVDNSLPEKDPFCYYRLKDENILQLSFSLNDSYFQPEFNSEIRVITYSTKGADGNFTKYDGTNTIVEKDTETYSYNENFIMGAIATGSSLNGQNHLSIEELRRLVNTQFKTATVLSTDADLELYFYNYEERNANLIKFIKRRDDQVSRMYTGFMVCKNEDYVYPTNTLDIDTNFTYWKNPEGGSTYIMEPGHLFTYSGDSNRIVKPVRKRGFDEKEPFINFQGQTIQEWIFQDYFIWLFETYPESVPNFDRNDPNWRVNWIPLKEEGKTLQYFIDNILYTCPDCGYHSHSTRTNEEGKQVCLCCGSEKIATGVDSMESFYMTVYDADEIEATFAPNDFVYANPFLTTVTKYPGLINYYLTIINQTSILDFLQYNYNCDLQFIINQATFTRPLAREKEYTVTLPLMSSMQWNPELLVPGITGDNYIPRRAKLSNNFLRVFMIVMDGGVECCYLEMVPVEVNDEDHIIFQARFRVNDHVTLGNQVQMDDYNNDELGYIPHYDPGMGTEYTLKEQEMLKIWVQDNKEPVKTFSKEEEEEEDPEKWKEEEVDNSGIQGNFTYITNENTKLIPMNEVDIRFVVLYKQYEEDSEENPRVTENYPTNANFFNLYDYQWTNIYSTSTDRVDFVKPLNMVRSSLYFKDDRLLDVMPGDIYMYSCPMIKHSLLQHYDSNGYLTKNENGVSNFDMFSYLIDKYYEQYMHLEETLSTTICQATTIDIKFYNTYGRSKNYIIGDDDDIIDRVNMSIAFLVYLVDGTDPIMAGDNIKTFIKETVEDLNIYGHNDMHISNLMRTMETEFAYIDHIRFVGINGLVENGEYKMTDTMGYSTEYQSIRNITRDLTELSKDERFNYVPEMLCLNKDQICLTFYEES